MDKLPVREGPMVRDPTCIGGSDSAAIVGKDPHKTGYLVAQRILGQIESDQLDGLDHIEFGNEMEHVLARFYERKNKVKLYTPQTMKHPKYPFLTVNIDRVREDRMDLAIECKNTGLHVQEAWGDQNTDQVPARVLLQCMHGMMVVPCIDIFHVLRCYGGNTYQMYVVERNTKLITRLEELEVEFYENVMKGVLPSPQYDHPTTKDTLKRVFREIEGEGPIENMPQLDTLTADWEVVAAQRLALQKKEEELKNQIEHIMGNTGVAVLSDGRRWRRAKVNRKGYEVKPTSYIECRLLKA